MIKLDISITGKKNATKKWLDNIATQQRKYSLPKLRKLFNETTFGWKTKPRMGWAQTKNSGEISLKIYPVGDGSDTWNLLNEGSPAHSIRAKRKYMSFRKGYKASTTPGILRSKRAYRSGPYWKTNFIARHPGFPARKFTELIAEKYAEGFQSDMQSAINKTAKNG